MWWHGGAGLLERSERGTLYAVATHDLFAFGIPEPVDRRISGESVARQGANRADERSRRNPPCGKAQTGWMTDHAGSLAGERVLPTLPPAVGGHPNRNHARTPIQRN